MKSIKSSANLPFLLSFPLFAFFTCFSLSFISCLQYSTIAMTLDSAMQLDRTRRKRLKVPSACGQCRRKKTKCDGEQPCAGCIKSRVECLYAPSPAMARRINNIHLSRAPPTLRSAAERPRKQQPAADHQDHDINIQSTPPIKRSSYNHPRNPQHQQQQPIAGKHRQEQQLQQRQEQQQQQQQHRYLPMRESKSVCANKPNAHIQAIEERLSVIENILVSLLENHQRHHAASSAITETSYHNRYHPYLPIRTQDFRHSRIVRKRQHSDSDVKKELLEDIDEDEDEEVEVEEKRQQQQQRLPPPLVLLPPARCGGGVPPFVASGEGSSMTTAAAERFFPPVHLPPLKPTADAGGGGLGRKASIHSLLNGQRVPGFCSYSSNSSSLPNAATVNTSPLSSSSCTSSSPTSSSARILPPSSSLHHQPPPPSSSSSAFHRIKSETTLFS